MVSQMSSIQAAQTELLPACPRDLFSAIVVRQKAMKRREKSSDWARELRARNKNRKNRATRRRVRELERSRHLETDQSLDRFPKKWASETLSVKEAPKQSLCTSRAGNASESSWATQQSMMLSALEARL